jgi:hypothetical protein
VKRNDRHLRRSDRRDESANAIASSNRCSVRSNPADAVVVAAEEGEIAFSRPLRSRSSERHRRHNNRYRVVIADGVDVDFADAGAAATEAAIIRHRNLPKPN